MFAIRPQPVRPFLFSLLVVSALSSKLLHLFQHVNSIPHPLFVVYFSTFFIQEILLFVAVWFMLHKTSGAKYVAAAVFSGILAFTTLAAASSQLGFYSVTGSEIRWDAAKSVGNDPEGRKLMLSGLRPVLIATTFLLVVTWFSASSIYGLMTHWMSALLSRADPEDSSKILPGANTQTRHRTGGPARFWTGCVAAGTLILWLIRPTVPYRHISGALPFTLFQALGSHSSHETAVLTFPFPKLLEGEFWEAPNGHYKGWAPGEEGLAQAGEYFNSQPAWASGDLPAGFGRWAEDANPTSIDDENTTASEARQFYNPVSDPLRITNLDLDMVEPLQQALKDHNVPITHVVLVMMESTRKDVFPFKAGSHLHDKIIQSHDSTDSELIDKVNSRLSWMTPVSEQLTGESSGFSAPHEKDLPEGLWKDSAKPGMGGINVDGIWTGSSLSFKSAVVNHCGVGPLPVDFMDEVNADIYQPCIMQVLELFNQLKDESSAHSKRFFGIGKHGKGNSDKEKPETTSTPIHDRKWKSVFAQSITGLYDSQDILNEKMGFNESIYREQIYKSGAKYYHSDMEKINYFGYPENEVYPYLKDVINDAVANDTRLFLSHFTSTTHHPWNTPSGYKNKVYFSETNMLEDHEDMNKYLNTVRYVDTWLGDLMKLLEETGIAKETLVVMVGDHGQAFHEDAPVSGTYENGHISNFRIPLIFRHPQLPRMQITANTTSISIIPTILDLLASTGSLNAKDSDIAMDLANEYEGQSLIRPFKSTHNGRQAWNFGIINAGGTMLSVGSAAVPYRVIIPLTEDFEYKFSHLEKDPNEVDLISDWDLEQLAYQVRRVHGEEAAEWVVDADKVGRWWVQERKRLWNHQERE